MPIGSFIIRALAATLVVSAASAPMVARAAGPDAALIEARRQKSNPALNMLTYRHFDELFATRTVAAGGLSTPLPKSPLSLPDDRILRIGDASTSLDDFLAQERINALLVLKDGRVVREIYRNGGAADDRFIAFSMSKSVISMLFGIALADGSIGSIEDPVIKYLPDLRGTAYDSVTLKHLLTMRTGTSWNEDYAPGSELDRHRDLSQNTEQVYYEDYAAQVKSIAPPGSRFNYATLDTELLGSVLARATGRTIADFMTERLWKPAGMEASAYWAMQGPTGRQHEFYGAGLAATLRDFGRIGQMMLDEGAVDGRQVVPKSWAIQSTGSAVPGSTYFYQWWAIPGMNAFAARGVYGQSIMIDRPSRTVMVILSYRDGAGGGRNATPFFKAVIAQLEQQNQR